MPRRAGAVESSASRLVPPLRFLFRDVASPRCPFAEMSLDKLNPAVGARTPWCLAPTDDISWDYSPKIKRTNRTTPHLKVGTGCPHALLLTSICTLADKNGVKGAVVATEFAVRTRGTVRCCRLSASKYFLRHVLVHLCAPVVHERLLERLRSAC